MMRNTKLDFKSGVRNTTGARFAIANQITPTPDLVIANALATDATGEIMSTIPNDKAVSVLNELIETCKDGAKGFSDAAEHAKAPHLKAVFTKYAAQRNSFAADLDGFVVSYRGKPAESGHVSATVHRGWMNLKAAVASNGDKGILNECERGEDAAKKAYADALKEELPADLRTVIRRQANEVVAAHDTVRDLRDQANASDGASKAYPDTRDASEPVYRD